MAGFRPGGTAWTAWTALGTCLLLASLWQGTFLVAPETGFAATLTPGDAFQYEVVRARAGPAQNYFWTGTAHVRYTVAPGSTANYTLRGVQPWAKSLYRPREPQAFGDLAIGNLTRHNESADFLGDNFLLFARDFHGNFVISLDWDAHEAAIEAAGGHASTVQWEWNETPLEAWRFQWHDAVQSLDVTFHQATGVLLHANASIEYAVPIYFEFRLLVTTVALASGAATHIGGIPFSWLLGMCGAALLGLEEVRVARARREGKRDHL